MEAVSGHCSCCLASYHAVFVAENLKKHEIMQKSDKKFAFVRTDTTVSSIF